MVEVKLQFMPTRGGHTAVRRTIKVENVCYIYESSCTPITHPFPPQTVTPSTPPNTHIVTGEYAIVLDHRWSIVLTVN